MAPMSPPSVLRTAFVRACAGVLGCFLLTSASHAHLPEYFGRKYVLTGALPERSEACAGDRDALRARLAILEDQLTTREREEGAYSIGLADPAGEVAKVQAALCNHPAALEANRRALQLLRINEGLLSRTQIPHLKAMADSSQAIGDYESAQATLRYIFRIQGMGLGDLAPDALADALAYFQRARDIFIDPRSGGDLDLFFEAFEDNRAMYDAQLARGHEGGALPYDTLKAVSLSHLANLYLILGTDMTVYGSGASDAGGARWDFMQRMQQLTYGKGLDLINALLEHPSVVGPERARLLLRLGNWQQWNGKWQSACESYEMAWAAADEALRERLAQPAELPEDPSLWTSLRSPEIPALTEVEASFRVSRRGIVSRVDGGAVGEGGSGRAARVLRWLRDSHMRPAIRDGACIDASLKGRRYRLLD